VNEYHEVLTCTAEIIQLNTNPQAGITQSPSNRPKLTTLEAGRAYERLQCIKAQLGDCFGSVTFYARKQLCFQRVLATAILSVRLSVCLSVRLSVTRVDQAKTVQARITKSLPSAAWKTLVSGTVKLFHKFEGGHPERGR